jgi:hypothetical protein
MQPTLDAFKKSAAQCSLLIANAHRLDATGTAILPALDQRQITVAAMLNLFVAWESFLEDAMALVLSGTPTLSGKVPLRYATPTSPTHARDMVVGTRPFFDYGRHDNVRTLVRLFLDQGYPFEPHLSTVSPDLADMKTMRNSAAHLSSSTQRALEALAQRVFKTPQPGIELYTLLTRVDPRSPSGDTVFGQARDMLLATAEFIAVG